MKSHKKTHATTKRGNTSKRFNVFQTDPEQDLNHRIVTTFLIHATTEEAVRTLTEGLHFSHSPIGILIFPFFS